MQSLLQDLRYGLRQLVRNPGFALTAVISLALGIGTTTAVFSVIYAALLNPYPYAGVDRIVRLTLQSKAGGDLATLTGPQIRQLQRVPAVESVLAMAYHGFTLTGHDAPLSVYAVDLISTGFADLGVPAVLSHAALAGANALSAASASSLVSARLSAGLSQSIALAVGDHARFPLLSALISPVTPVL